MYMAPSFDATCSDTMKKMSYASTFSEESDSEESARNDFVMSETPSTASTQAPSQQGSSPALTLATLKKLDELQQVIGFTSPVTQLSETWDSGSCYCYDASETSSVYSVGKPQRACCLHEGFMDSPRSCTSSEVRIADRVHWDR
eukprot:TRINITY_DN17266_c0_g2_i1.p1 TRINITY_DN17266_c0_g2~~TRINITY_DN17266_c0_g2_i1.p1  ORF type:complete len:144 (+),score=18.76 TRINITY_DN17266_c0_g2_i1:61-492(+)